MIAPAGRPLSEYRSHRKETELEASHRRVIEATTAEFAEGEKAFLDGLGESANTYKSEGGLSQQRYRWFQGFYHARLAKKGFD